MSGGKIFRKFLIFLCLAALMLTGCTSAKTEEAAQQETDGKEENGEKKIQIGLTVDSFVIERWIRDRDVFVATARDLGAEVNVQDAGADAQEQISQIDYFIKKHMDVIVIIARDCGALSEAVERAHSSGIRVISYDRMVNDANTDMYISFDNRMVGEIMAQSMEEAIPDGGKIFMIQGSATDNNVAMVKEGFEDTLQGSNLQVVYEANCEGWTAELAVDYVEEALEEYPDVKGIFATNETVADLVVNVLDSMDKTTGEDRIKVVSFDGGEDQMKLLEDGKIDGLIVQNPYGIGYATVVACARAVLGQGNEAKVSTGYTWVTKDNMNKDSIKKMLY